MQSCPARIVGSMRLRVGGKVSQAQQTEACDNCKEDRLCVLLARPSSCLPVRYLSWLQHVLQAQAGNQLGALACQA